MEAPLGPRSSEARRVRRLVTKRAVRDADGVCVVEGVRALTAALTAEAEAQSDVKVEAVYAAPGAEAHEDVLE